jgi:pathogenesis-related protein 1
MKSSFLIVICVLLCTAVLQAQQVPVTSGSKVSQSEAQTALDFHNKVRQDVGSPALQWSAELAAFAQAWANHLATTCKMEHRPDSGPWAQKYGENIFWGGGEVYTALNASENWYSEIKEYKYGPLTNSNWYKTGHYTQMVWKNTTHFGIAKATCKNGTILIVANYSPSGNYLGERPY